MTNISNVFNIVFEASREPDLLLLLADATAVNAGMGGL